MARQNITVNPEQKLFEAYMDYSGGHNSEASNERLKDNEFPVLENVDLSGRGSAKRRTGRSLFAQVTGKAQGMFFYYRIDQNKPDIILAAGGKLYVIPNGSNTPTEVVIKDGTADWTFQATLPIEAVQYKVDMFIATGSKLVELMYDDTTSTWKAKTVEPYKPTVMEAIHIGTNAFASNPDAYVQDGVSSELKAIGVKPAKPTGVVSEKMQMIAYIEKPTSIANVQYKWEYKKTSATTWVLGRDWTDNDAGKTWADFLPTEAGQWDIQVTVRDKAVTTTSSLYVLSAYQVNITENKTVNNTLPNGGIQKCRKITLHWDRLLLSLDDENPYQMYITDLMNPRYAPSTNTISFDAGKQEPITSVVKYRNYILVFTRSTIQTLTGKSTDDYQRNLIHDGIGCISDRSAMVVGNNVIFLSQEGIHKLTPNQFQQETLNVSRIDNAIKSEIIPGNDACAIVYDNQYWVCFPQTKLIFRYYYEEGKWVRDKSSKLNFAQFLQYGDDVYNLTVDSKVYKHDEDNWADDGEIYEMKPQSKFLDLSASFNFKRLKRLYVLAEHHNTELFVTVQADSHIVLTPESGTTTVNEATGEVEWSSTTEPNFHFYSGTTFGTWLVGISPFGDPALSVQKAQLRGKCRRVKVTMVHKQNAPCEIYGFGLEFKLKKV